MSAAMGFNRGLKASGRCRDFIKSFESLRLRAYRCPSGIPTIGWGSTSGVKMGQQIEESEAERMLSLDIGYAEGLILERVKSPMTQGQFDALVSFVFNMRNPHVNFTEQKCTLLRQLNAGQYGAAADEFPRWVHGRDQFGKAVQLPGLVRRRAAEREMFLSGQDGPAASG